MRPLEVVAHPTRPFPEKVLLALHFGQERDIELLIVRAMGPFYPAIGTLFFPGKLH